MHRSEVPRTMINAYPAVDVAVTTYNRADKCFRAVSYIVSQNSDNKIVSQIIVVDDCSTHAFSSELTGVLRSNEVTLIRHERNSGLAAARNSALMASRSEWFSFCDDDDLWPPGFAEKLVKTAKSAPQEVGVILGLSEERRKFCGAFFDRFPSVQEVMLAGITPPVASQMYRTQMLKYSGGYDENIRSGVDHDLWINLAHSVNPRVAVAWGATPVVGKDENQRMTTVDHTRRQGIAAALKIWEPKITNTFGEEFYIHFAQSYIRYLEFSFLIHEIRAKKYMLALIKLKNPVLLFDVIRALILRNQKHCNQFPSFNCGLP